MEGHLPNLTTRQMLGRNCQGTALCRRRTCPVAFQQRPNKPSRKSLPCRCQAQEGGHSSPMSQFRAWASNTFLNIGVNGQAPAKPVSEALVPVDADTPPVPARGASDQSWDKWQEFFAKLDLQRDEEDFYWGSLHEAVNAAQYEDCAEIRDKLDELQGQNLVYGVMKSFKEAVKQEDYEMAMRLRDEAGAGLVGWWVAQSETDQCGHLLQIYPCYGRYVGVIYKAGELADLKGYLDSLNSPGRRQEGDKGYFEPQDVPVNGQVFMEIFLTSREDGSFQTVPVYLPPPKAGSGPGKSKLRVNVFDATGKNLYGSGDLEVDLANSSDGQPQDAGDSDVTPLPRSPQAESSKSDDDDQEGFQASASGKSDDVIERLAGALSAFHETDVTAFENIVREGGSIEVEAGEEAGMPFIQPTSIVRELANLMILDKDRFAFSPIKSVSDDLEPDSDPASSSPSPARDGRTSLEASKDRGQFVNTFMNKFDNPRYFPESMRAEMKEHLQQAAETMFNLRRPYDLDGMVIYKRLTSPGPKTDPFSGYFLGAFGPNGHELLRLHREIFNGEEYVVGTKLTGDNNVPAGAPSFKAKIGRRHRLPNNEYPPELGVVARYKGQGCIAEKGFKDPRWVDGELLQFTGNFNAITRGAEWGFVWVVPGERRYLILLSRIDLEDCLED